MQSNANAPHSPLFSTLVRHRYQTPGSFFYILQQLNQLHKSADLSASSHLKIQGLILANEGEKQFSVGISSDVLSVRLSWQMKDKNSSLLV